MKQKIFFSRSIQFFILGVFVMFIFVGQAKAANIYACIADDGKYACSNGNQPNLSDTPSCSGKTPVQIDSSKCGQLAQNSNPNPTGGINSNPNPTGASNSNPNPTPASGSDCTSNPSGPDCVYNPLPVDNLVAFLLLAMKWMLGLIGSFSVLFIMIGGFRMVLAQGNEEAYGVAKKTITWAIIGLVIAVLSFSMVAIVSNLLNANVKDVTQTNVNSTFKPTPAP